MFRIKTNKQIRNNSLFDVSACLDLLTDAIRRPLAPLNARVCRAAGGEHAPKERNAVRLDEQKLFGQQFRDFLIEGFAAQVFRNDFAFGVD